MLSPRQRIAQQMKSSALTSLYRALTRLKSPVTVMNTGAHPDDEQSGMLAWMSLGLGMRIIIGCSTRGEGGQNILGPERTGALGVLRTREMEEAARILDADVCWLGHGPDDPVQDFGFSKDGDGTFARWGEERIVERLVRAYRKERPDIVIPTFLDVPGQHGHHRAMTRAAETALALAASEDAYVGHFDGGLKPWTVEKFYLPAWSGGGGTYDDALPPPPETLRITAEHKDFATGVDYDRIGEWSRYYHASQGMGHWPDEPVCEWPLHLLRTRASAPVSTNENSILDGLPTSLTALCDDSTDLLPLRPNLYGADQAIAAALTAFPDRIAIREHLSVAAQKVEIVLAAASEAFLDQHQHRLLRKLREIDAAILESQQVFERAYAETDLFSPGCTTRLTVSLNEDSDTQLDVHPIMPDRVTAEEITCQSGKKCFTLKASDQTEYSAQFPRGWSSLGGNGDFSFQASTKLNGRTVTGMFDLETPLSIAPEHSVSIRPAAILLPLSVESTKSEFHVSSTSRPEEIEFQAPEGWSVARNQQNWTVITPRSLSPGLTTLIPTLKGGPAYRDVLFEYPHIGTCHFAQPESLQILALDLKLPKNTKIGYVAGGADDVGTWLGRMGLDVTILDSQALSGDLSVYTSIVIGIFAFGTRPDLAAAISKLHQYVESGGHLVTLYHRPSDGWHPDATPPRYLKIGSPSLRWRVTDPEAKVSVTLPDHKLLNGPNLIDKEDWTGWNKERGLYFAADWDEAYEPLLTMHDHGEKPLKGALLSAIIGKGRHTHTSLVLHHQMEKLVPGAFRLMANLVQPA